MQKSAIVIPHAIDEDRFMPDAQRKSA